MWQSSSHWDVIRNWIVGKLIMKVIFSLIKGQIQFSWTDKINFLFCSLNSDMRLQFVSGRKEGTWLTPFVTWNCPKWLTSRLCYVKKTICFSWIAGFFDLQPNIIPTTVPFSNQVQYILRGVTTVSLLSSKTCP